METGKNVLILKKKSYLFKNDKILRKSDKN